eukprot:CAMPEP_0185776294 /NCGR_PEP_ID=MMETSP1174-20130828/85126_1 /TAXON_ID=35687 /ORGANISM="Dictyocha speculum, Strain CCMP1381" /LENGTH=152 /DNA_ID=CAMNT_0028464183 /DNA_START=91 /DNA_END=549 /DNA_ORIENTATION=+
MEEKAEAESFGSSTDRQHTGSISGATTPTNTTPTLVPQLSNTCVDDMHLGDAMHDPLIAPVEPVVVTTLEEARSLMADSRYRPPLPFKAPAALLSILRSCWSHEAGDRPTFTAVVEKVRATRNANPNHKFPSEVVSFACYADPSTTTSLARV